MRVQLLSYNYDPEPSGIAPLSTAVARGLRRRGHDVLVVAAHPHYPAPEWGVRLRPYRERRDDIPVLRLPLWMGRETAAERLRQEATFCAGLTATLALLPRADVLLVASPSFPAILPSMLHARARRTPWVLWVHDLLPDGAQITDILDEGPALRAARALERTAYRSARQIAVISDAVRDNLIGKGVPPEKVHRIYSPAPRAVEPYVRPARDAPARVLWMGNIGRTQNLAEVVRTLRSSNVLEDAGARLAIAGAGVEEAAVRHEADGAAVDVLGVLHGAEVDAELRRATVGLVTQVPGLTEFNLPSRMMHFFVRGVPVVAVVGQDSETAHLVRSSGGGWVVDSASLDELPAMVRSVLSDRADVERRSRAAYDYAVEHFDQDRVTGAFEALLERAVSG